MNVRPFLISLLIIGVFFSCSKESGPMGETGAQGPQGPQGEQGAAGDSGVNGYTSIVKITPFAPNAACKNGGVTIQSGIDKNKNKVLDTNEIDNSEDVCNGTNGQDGESANLIPIQLIGTESHVNTTDTTITAFLPKFNKLDYEGVDSIIFVADPYVRINSNSSIVELFNITDNKLIAGSTLQSNETDPYTFLQTGNLYKAFPPHEITLGINQRSTVAGGVAIVGSCYLYMYRH